MRQKNIKDSSIPDFSSDDEAFDWYESHEITDHLEETEEVSPSSVFYQDAKNQWFRASDGLLVKNTRKDKVGHFGYTPQNQGHIIYGAPLITVPVTVLKMPKQQQSAQTYAQKVDNFIIEGDKVLCKLTTLSSATTLTLETK